MWEKELRQSPALPGTKGGGEGEAYPRPFFQMF